MTRDLRKFLECYRGESAESADPETFALRQALSADPAARAQWEAIQAWDSAIGRAMHEVPLPAGLEDRLLAALEPDNEQEGGKGRERVVLASSVRSPRVDRRWLRVAAAVVSAAALLAVVVFVASYRDTLTTDQVDQLARGWVDQLDREGWKQTSAPEDRWPDDRSLQFPHPIGWQEFQALQDSRAVAYLGHVPPARTTAYLLVIRTSQGRNLRNSPPLLPDSTTGGKCVGVWTSGDYLFVLVVEGDQRTYRRLLNSQSFALRSPQSWAERHRWSA